MSKLKEWVIAYMVSNRAHVNEYERLKIKAQYDHYFSACQTDEQFYEKISDDWMKMGFEAGRRNGIEESMRYHASQMQSESVNALDFNNPMHQILVSQLADVYERTGYDDSFPTLVIDCLQTIGRAFSENDAKYLRLFFGTQKRVGL